MPARRGANTRCPKAWKTSTPLPARETRELILLVDTGSLHKATVLDKRVAAEWVIVRCACAHGSSVWTNITIDRAAPHFALIRTCAGLPAITGRQCTVL